MAGTASGGAAANQAATASGGAAANWAATASGGAAANWTPHGGAAASRTSPALVVATSTGCGSGPASVAEPLGQGSAWKRDGATWNGLLCCSA